MKTIFDRDGEPLGWAFTDTLTGAITFVPLG
jgi:hypothetical protein